MTQAKELAKSFDPKDIEARWYPAWENAGYFKAGLDTSKQDNFCILLPPPNVTGTLHMGHGFNQTLMDALTRYHRMKGDNTLWQPGTDHAGIATQIVVERQLDAQGVSRHDLGREKFIEKVWEWKEYSGNTITKQMRRLGTSPDWSRERFTMDAGLNKTVTATFVRLFNEGLIYRGKRLVNWDPKLHTAVSDLEVVQEEEDGFMWHIRYPLADGEGFLTVATTRPETMLGDVAVMVHPEDERYKHLIGKQVTLPLCERTIPVIADDYVDKEFGTGCVKVTPAHDFNDYAVGQRHGLEMISVLTLDAKINEHAPEKYQGLDRFEARKQIVADLETLGLFEKTEKHKLKVPRGDRTGVVIEPMLTDQWFVAMSKAGPEGKSITEQALECVSSGEIRFHPENWVNTYNQWLNNIQDWCISRQLWWGHQIPAWYGTNGEVFVACDADEARQLADKAGYAGQLDRDNDVLDTWFSSALWPFSTLDWEEGKPFDAQNAFVKQYLPSSVLVTGFDIIFFWVARMMMMGLHFQKQIPFGAVYVHALVRDEDGKKMSKSLGNVIDPLDLIDKYGADAVRMTLAAMAAMGRDLRLSEARVEGYRNFGTKLWNAARFAEINGCAPDPAFDPRSCALPVNRWMVGETARLRESVDAALEAFRFNDAASALYAHVWGVLCDWYLELAKPALQGDDGPDKAETQAAVAWALDQALILLHPVMPFVTEELWGATAERAKMLVHADWPTYAAADMADPQADADIAWTIALIEGVRSARAEMNVAPGPLIPLVAVGADAATRARLARVDALIRRLARLESVTLADAAPKGAVTLAVEGATLCLPLAGVIDIAAERARLARALEKLEKERGGVAAKLANPAFIEKAREDVVAKERARLETLALDADKLAAAAARLAEIA